MTANLKLPPDRMQWYRASLNFQAAFTSLLVAYHRAEFEAQEPGVAAGIFSEISEGLKRLGLQAIPADWIGFKSQPLHATRETGGPNFVVGKMDVGSTVRRMVAEQDPAAGEWAEPQTPPPEPEVVTAHVSSHRCECGVTSWKYNGVHHYCTHCGRPFPIPHVADALKAWADEAASADHDPEFEHRIQRPPSQA